MSTPVDQLESQLASEESQLKGKLDAALGHWRELSARLRALQTQLDEATALGVSVGPLGDRVRGLSMPVIQSGAAALRSATLRRDAINARRAALQQLAVRVPQLEAEL